MEIWKHVAWAFLLFATILGQISNYKTKEKLDLALVKLGYYELRFGHVSLEDMMNGVGITEECIQRYEKELENREKNEK